MADNDRGPAGHSGAGQSTAEEVAVIPLVEERLSVGKREIETGRVRVRVTVDEHEELVSQQLSRDDVQIERVPRNERLTEIPRVRLEGNVTIIPVVEEVLVIEKDLVLVEEIRICRRPVSEPANIPVKLRSERATVERVSGEPSEAEAE